jgi:hypothetical protein
MMIVVLTEKKTPEPNRTGSKFVLKCLVMIHSFLMLQNDNHYANEISIQPECKNMLFGLSGESSHGTATRVVVAALQLELLYLHCN